MSEQFEEPVELQEWYDIGAEIRVNIRMQFSKIKRKHQEEIKDLQAKLETAREALKEFALGESQFMDGVECMHKARQALKEIEK